MNHLISSILIILKHAHNYLPNRSCIEFYANVVKLSFSFSHIARLLFLMS